MKGDTVNYIKTGFAIAGTVFTYLFGGFDRVFQTLLVFIVIDYITGISKAYVSGNVNSYKGIKGITKKIFVLFLVAMGNMLDGIMNVQEPYIRTVVCYFLIANEGISILENLAVIGIPIPDKLKSVLEALKEDKKA